MAGEASPGRTWRIVLVISLALNLLVAGIVIGAVVTGRDAGPAPRVDLGFGPMGRALSAEDRRAIAEAVRSEPGIRSFGPRSRRETVERTVAALRADPFDPAALAAVFDDSRDRAAQALATGQAAVVAHVAAMSPEARAALADRLEQESRHPRDGERARKRDLGGRP